MNWDRSVLYFIIWFLLIPCLQVNHGNQLLMDVRSDLNDVLDVCQGKKKQTNNDRALIENLAKGMLPRRWNRYTVPAGLTVIQWVSDFSDRINQLQKISLATTSGGSKELKVSISVSISCLNNCIEMNLYFIFNASVIECCIKILEKEFLATVWILHTTNNVILYKWCKRMSSLYRLSKT